MKYILCAAVSIISWLFCNSQEPNFILKGKLPADSKAEKVYVQNSHLDLEIPVSQNKEFYYSGILSEPAFTFIRTDKSLSWTFWIAPGTIEMSLEEWSETSTKDTSEKKF